MRIDLQSYKQIVCLIVKSTTDHNISTYTMMLKELCALYYWKRERHIWPLIETYMYRGPNMAYISDIEIGQNGDQITRQ